ncbi:RAD9, HUS1, RAD1-interacting nuclear orphan protein 1 [Periophthalmus magnuspinnatus]|uniref:RAD9, HUS1, RAD1-interacting nuclear orphan protein 1 n=1 Tax=Periophthalmus magnuspinnatus TaxID=409849 RepID=UPI00145A7BD5|nr:RAD9, HUS1, RAD1-interacting nuclear orphan protein 1 [Periophthalmus magnuspinnatus]
MPRKKIKTDKQPLRFLERPAGEARVQHNVPEVRAALNPKDFFKETQEHNGSSLNSWVNPQFDTSCATLQTKKRRRCQSTTSIIGNFTQLSRKGSVCSSRFPTLLFEKREQHSQKEKKKASNDCSSSASNESYHQAFCQNTNAVCNVPNMEILHQNDIVKVYNGSDLKKKTTPSQIQFFTASETSCLLLENPSSHRSKDCTNADNAPVQLSTIKPTITEKYSTYSHLLCSPPTCTPPGSRILDTLAPDTPERDYGVKVTWRRRRSLMLLLKEKGHLSDSDSIIHI